MLYDKRWEKKLRKPRTKAEVYMAAADALEKHGHALHKLQDERGRMCLWGAVNFVVNGDPMSLKGDTSEKYVQPLRPFIRGKHPIVWNNRVSRRRADVVRLLRRAAAEVR
jgi:hypothetical protein